MATAKERLDALNIHNPHNASTFAKARGGVGVYLDYRPQQTGRAFQSAGWQVIRPGAKTDPTEHWRNYGHKTFDVFGREQKEPQQQAAQEWASEHFGVTEWVKIPGLPGALFPAQDAAILREALKEVP